MGPFWLIPGGRAKCDLSGSIGVLEIRCGGGRSGPGEDRRSLVDLAGVIPQRPKTQPPTFFPMPPSLEWEDEIERTSLLLPLVPMLERR
jgi:hypothetical protein